MRYIFHSPSEYDYDPLNPKKMKVQKGALDQKHLKEFTSKGITRPTKSLVQAKVLHLLEDRIENFLATPDIDMEVEEEIEIEDSVYGAVLLFMEVFTHLKEENISENFRIAEALSEAWLILNQEISQNRSARNPPPYYADLKKFLQTLNRYPETGDHTFGYYLNQYTGEKWLPFPFMDLLLTLHEDALLHKEKSTLQTWINQLSDLATHFES